MRRLALILMAVGGLLSACVAYEVPSRDARPYYGDRDRDNDGVPNRADRRPDDPRRY